MDESERDGTHRSLARPSHFDSLDERHKDSCCGGSGRPRTPVSSSWDSLLCDTGERQINQLCNKSLMVQNLHYFNLHMSS
ncbi:hypothetical protein E2C01_008155 [Portunus trituberculatus]|uniref:Uncharacterized protein n=1 Tax=Portunus trituberculatus TaxID=210409 RepID=A0A5B7D022_PORTR|nr:hypothetical protein [Portunus trituberculatus]